MIPVTWLNRSVTSTWMSSKCRMGVHSEFLQEHFSNFERKTFVESLHAHLCRMIVVPYDCCAVWLCHISVVKIHCYIILKISFLQGYIYARPPNSEITFVKTMTVKDYLNVMLANDAVREQILKNLSKLQRILSEDTWMSSKCRMGAHSEFLQKHFSNFERKTFVESLHAHLCRMIVVPYDCTI
jgi:hypothetical protein